MAPRLEVQELIGHKLVDQDGHNVGKIRQVYRDDQTHQPTWVTVHTGMFGHQENFVPLVGAEVTEQELRVPFSRKVIKDSPRFDTGGHLSPEEEAQLYQYYGVRPTVPGPRGDMEDAVAEERAREAPEGETSMTISEERAWVGVERTESGHARVHKTVESEQFEQDVPVHREELRIEREPVTDEEQAATRGQIGEQEQEITLHEERAVVGKEEVPVEKVRISKEEVTDTERVKGELRKEHLEVEEDEEQKPGRPRPQE